MSLMDKVKSFFSGGSHDHGDPDHSHDHGDHSHGDHDHSHEPAATMPTEPESDDRPA